MRTWLKRLLLKIRRIFRLEAQDQALADLARFTKGG